MEQELVEIQKSRTKRKREDRVKEQGKDHKDSKERAGRSRLLGLAFSGGGIRSATFNLGVLQGLSELGLLSKFDYLSSVSGGGYIASWLQAWIARRGLPDAEKGLKTASRKMDPLETPAIRRLREFSNYLTPRKGLLSGDTWAFLSSYFRNLVLNLIILVLALVALLLLSRPLILYFWLIASDASRGHRALAAALGVLLVPLFFIIRNLSHLGRTSKAADPEEKEPFYSRRIWIGIFVVGYTLAGAWLLGAWAWTAFQGVQGLRFWNRAILWDRMSWFLFFTGILSPLAFWLISNLAFWLISKCKRSADASGLERAMPGSEAPPNAKRMERKNSLPAVILGFFLAVLIGGELLAALVKWLHSWSQASTMGVPSWHFAYWGFPLTVAVILLAGTVHIGVVGEGYTEHAREWWGRLGGDLTRWMLCLMALFLIAIDGPWVLAWEETHTNVKWLLTALWGAISGGGVLAGRHPSTSVRGSKTGLEWLGKVALEWLGKVAPAVFVVGLLLILASFTNQVLPDALSRFHSWIGHTWPGSWPPEAIYGRELELQYAHQEHWRLVERSLDGCVLLFSLLLGLAAVGISWRVGVNTFAIHALYRNRLARCYLGATNDRQTLDTYARFDPSDDDIRLADLVCRNSNPSDQKYAKYAGPYPILNATLNLTTGERLAWQTRKAASFIFTPLYCGYEILETKKNQVQFAYAPTQDYGKNQSLPITLGTALAISGAAASPNMGYHSSPALAFLMTVFNVRLGWWLRNPIKFSNWCRSSNPPVALYYLLSELLGKSSERRNFVYLSDGGHFENLGLYELVKRRCRFIVVCDAEEDRDRKFVGLGNAIEKCRTDFGVDIDINIEQLRREEVSGKSQRHCAVGLIHYERENENIPCGTLLYLKTSLTGDEPTDVQRYAAQNKEFPHQTTADQWFDESQFESYRALGHHVVTSVLEAACDADQIAGLPVEELFAQLRHRWYPPSAAVTVSFTKHTATYTELMRKLQDDPDLQFLDTQLFPEWPRLWKAWRQDSPAGAPGIAASRPRLWLPANESQLRTGFYFCNQMIQLMEDVYIDLQLEEEHDHPDNRGWMNLFHHWAWSGMVRATWAVSASIYGARFQRFCERHLDFHPGTVQVRPEQALVLTEDDQQCDRTLQIAVNDQRLNFWEKKLIQTFLKWGRPPEELKRLLPLHVLPFEVVVESPLGKDAELRYTFGFALARITDTDADLVYFRVQDHLRKMGLAAQALRVLKKQYQLQNKVEKADIENAKKSGQLPAESPLWEALPTEQTKQKFKRLFDCTPRGKTTLPDS